MSNSSDHRVLAESREESYSRRNYVTFKDGSFYINRGYRFTASIALSYVERHALSWVGRDEERLVKEAAGVPMPPLASPSLSVPKPDPGVPTRSEPAPTAPPALQTLPHSAGETNRLNRVPSRSSPATEGGRSSSVPARAALAFGLVGAALFVVGIVLIIGNVTGLFPTFPFAGFIVTFIGGGLVAAANHSTKSS